MKSSSVARGLELPGGKKLAIHNHKHEVLSTFRLFPHALLRLLELLLKKPDLFGGAVDI